MISGDNSIGHKGKTSRMCRCGSTAEANSVVELVSTASDCTDVACVRSARKVFLDWSPSEAGRRVK